MKDCRDFETGLVELAHGGDAPAAATHARECPRCAERLAQLRTIAAALTLKTQLPSEEALRRAQALMPAPERRLARLVGSTLGLAGARKSTQDAFQLVYEAESFRARLLFEPVRQGWAITGRLEGEKGDVLAGGKIVVPDSEGRFDVELDRSAPLELSVRSRRYETVLPLPPEVASSGPERPS